MKRHIKRFAVGFFLIVALSGCGENIDKLVEALSVNGVNPQDPSAALDKPFETLGTTDESTGFGDLDMGLFNEEPSSLEKANAADPLVVINGAQLMEPTATTTDPDCPDPEGYFIRVRWGQIDVRDRVATGTDPVATSTPLEWINWSGSLTASHGRLRLVKTIAFEREGDHADSIVIEEDPKLIQFVSYTKPHFDGLLVRYQRCGEGTASSTDPTILPVDPVLTFSALGAPFTKEWKVSELAKLHETTPVHNVNHDLFQIQSVIRRLDRCEDGTGTMHGTWFKVNDRFGHIKGRVVSSEGTPVGHIKGFYSAQPDPVTHQFKMVAKLIGIRGGFLGIIQGIGTAGENGEGEFSADVFNRDREKIGTVVGRYHEGGINDGRRYKGRFLAKYELRQLCPVKGTEEPVSVTPGTVAP
jgi:hypothetical protein